MSEHIPEVMRAMQWTTSKGGIENTITLSNDTPVPKTTRQECVLVKVTYTTINPVDFKFPDAVPFLFRKPAIPCLDVAGTVVRCSSSSGFQIGDHVCGRTAPLKAGAMAEYVVVPACNLVKIPSGTVCARDAACLATAGLTAYQSLKPYIKAGDKVLINGASGGTGTFGIQLARALGAGHITAICSGANANMCLSLGADQVIDYKTHNVTTELASAGLQYDIAVDNVSFALFRSCAQFLKPAGLYISPALSPSLKTFADLLSATLLPTILGGVPRKLKVVGTRDDADMLKTLVQLVESNEVRVCVAKEYTFEEARQALKDFRSTSTPGKIVVRIEEEESTLPRGSARKLAL